MSDTQDASQNPAGFALELELDDVSERFFSQAPLARDDWQLPPLSSLQRIAMLTTAAPAMAMIAVAITLLF
jgi:hypothetical protein